MPGSTSPTLQDLAAARAKVAELEVAARAAIPKLWTCGVCGFENHPRNYGDIEGCEQCGARVWSPGHVIHGAA